MNFVTGGTGMLGSHLLYDLIKKGERVKALMRPSADISRVKKIFSYYSPDAAKMFNKIEWVEGDLLDYYSLGKALEETIHVYHCAAIVSFKSKKRNELIHNNVQGTANLVNASLEKNIEKFCHVSSIAALGKSEHSFYTTEEEQWLDSKNKSAYSISKHLAEMEVWRGIAEGLNAVIVNPGIILGPGNWNSGSAKMFTTIYDGLRFYTKGITGYVDVRDVSKAMIELTKSDISSERFILTSENLSYEKIFKLIAKYLNVRIPDVYARKWMSELGWRIEALKETLTKKPALITKAHARSSHQSTNYSNQKIVKTLNLNFIPIEKSIKDISKLFLREFK